MTADKPVTTHARSLLNRYSEDTSDTFVNGNRSRQMGSKSGLFKSLRRMIQG
jgi:hypothetical protein